MEELAQPVGTAALVGVVMALIDVIKKQMAKKNGGTVYNRINILEHKVQEMQEDVDELKTKLHAFHREFCEFREDVRIYWTRQDTREQVMREIQK